MKRRHLAPEERAEYDAAYEEAGLDPHGNPRPSDEIKTRLLARLEDAVQAGRRWAGYVMDDALEDGLLKSWKDWNNEQNRMKVIHNGVIVPARAVRGTRRRDSDTGTVMYQQAFWREMTWEDVRQQLDDARKRIDAEKVTVSIATRLLELKLRCPESAGPFDACDALSVDFEKYIAGEAECA